MSSATTAVQMNDDQYFFEGAEKLLELWFKPSDSSLRAIPRDRIDEFLDVARCKVLHSRHTQDIDSYVLSESSLFISDRRLIMKTCGATRLLQALPLILEFASQFANMNEVESVYYSRKNFLRPDLQPQLHKCFDDEVEYLDSFFEDGRAYCLGSLKLDRWYLYTMNRTQSEVMKKTPDATLEILMSELDDSVLKMFSKDVCEDGPDCTQRTGIDRLVPAGFDIHEELFDPCGYSMNAFADDCDQYATIHVTPEKEFSFASFETNQESNCLYKLTHQVIRTFRPRKLLMTVFSNENSKNGKDAQQQLWDREIPGYKRYSLQFVRLETETVVYAQFTRREGDSSSDEDDGARSE